MCNLNRMNICGPPFHTSSSHPLYRLAFFAHDLAPTSSLRVRISTSTQHKVSAFSRHDFAVNCHQPGLAYPQLSCPHVQAPSGAPHVGRRPPLSSSTRSNGGLVWIDRLGGTEGGGGSLGSVHRSGIEADSRRAVWIGQ